MNKRAALKALAATLVDVSGARGVIARARRRAAGGRRVLVLGYHRVVRDFADERTRAIESTLISQATFRQHVRFLADRFELATMSRALEVLSGRAPAARDLAVVTFDDGYADVRENALPVLREAGAPATLYVSTGVVSAAGHFPHDRLYALLEAWRADEGMRARTPERAARTLAAVGAPRGGARGWLSALIREKAPPELERLIEELSAAAGEKAPSPPGSARALDWDGVRELALAGWEIGAHTVTHAVLVQLGQDEMDRELAASREALERELRRSVRHFAYCNGYYNDALIGALRRAGYASAVTTEDRLNRPGDDPYRIARRVLWEGSARGPSGRTSRHLLACQLDDAWRALGFDASEPGRRPEPSPDEPQARRIA